MGLEAECLAGYAGRESSGKARLEEKEIYFGGEFRLKIDLGSIRSLETRAGRLHVGFGDGEKAWFELGKATEKWYRKIRYPRSRMDKLGVKTGQRVSVLGVEDASFWAELLQRTEDVSRDALVAESDFIFCYFAEQGDLERMPELEKSIRRDGSVWGLWRKGRPELKENDVRQTAISAGLVDVKVVSFSDELSGLKLMVPKKRR